MPPNGISRPNRSRSQRLKFSRVTLFWTSNFSRLTCHTPWAQYLILAICDKGVHRSISDVRQYNWHASPYHWSEWRGHWLFGKARAWYHWHSRSIWIYRPSDRTGRAVYLIGFEIVELSQMFHDSFVDRTERRSVESRETWPKYY